MEDQLYKILKKVVTEGYKLKSHHNNPQWKEALENAEELVLRESSRRKTK